MTKKLEIYIDGASKGNPGPSGIGVVICKDGQTIKNISGFIGNATNNIAEYTALIYALQEALMMRADSIVINTDSQLLSRQLNKEYRIRNLNLLGLYHQIQHLLSGFKEVRVNNIQRQDNKGADKLANKAIKEALKKAL
ncbi:MAG: ribonuclease HI family protein [Candidatus Omnitrophica bacterium]|nr:ribonuclease HI family protein [Candidatus Omnitrophota bacterium]